MHVRRPAVDPDASTTLGLSADQARALLAGAADYSPRMLALVALLPVDGLRISEALGLEVDDVQHTDRGHRIADLRRKGGRAALPPLVADAVDTYLAHRAGGHGPLFPTGTGARWQPGNAARALTALATLPMRAGRQGRPVRVTDQCWRSNRFWISGMSVANRSGAPANSSAPASRAAARSPGP